VTLKEIENFSEYEEAHGLLQIQSKGKEALITEEAKDE
jgi:hypothetical protein